MTISVLLTAFLNRLLEERLWQAVEISLSSRTPRSLEYDTSSEDLPASDCHRLGHGFKARLLPSSYRMLPRRRACRAHAPLFEWTNVGVFNLLTCVFIQRTVFKLSFLLFQSLFVYPAADSV